MVSRIEVRKILAAVAAALWICAAAPPVRAQETEAAFYKGKTVRIIVGYGAGGGYDIYARMIAPYIAQALGTTVVVENQPGAGGITALDNLVVAPPDGLQMMIVNGTGAALGQLISLPGVRYDLGKVGHLGTVSASPWVWLVAPNSPIKTPQDAINAHKRMMWSASGPIDGLSDGAAFTCEALALDCRVVMGYPGSNEAALAVGKGEMDAIYVSDTSANNYVKAGRGAGGGDDGPQEIAFLPRHADDFRSAQAHPRPGMAVRFSRDGRGSRPHPRRAAEPASGPARLSPGGGEKGAQRSGSHRRRRTHPALRRLSRCRADPRGDAESRRNDHARSSASG